MSSLLRGLAQVLIDSGTASNFGGTASWAIFVGELPTTPNACISIMQAGGLADNPKWAIDYPTVQVMIRGESNASNDAYNKAKGVKDALLGRVAATLPIIPGMSDPDYISSITMQGNIISMGKDELQRTMYSINFRLIVLPATTGNRLPL